MRLSGSLFDGGILRPSAGLLQCLHPLPVQGRPKRAVPSAARYYCVCPAQAPGAMLLSITPRHRTTCATARRKPPPPLSLRSRYAFAPRSLHARFTHAPRSLRSGFRLLQPAPVNCRPLPQPQLGEHRPPHSRPSPRASLVWLVCSVWPQTSQPCNPTRLINCQLPLIGTTSTARHSASRQHSINKHTPGAAAAPPPLRVLIIG